APTDHGPAARASDPAFEWADSDHDLTVRRDPDELLAVLRAENALAPRGRAARDAVPTAPELPTIRPRKLRAATEAAALLIGQSRDSPVLPLASPPETPSGITVPEGVAVKPSPAKPGASPTPVTASRMIGASLVEARSGRVRLRWIAAAAVLA